MSSQNTGQTAEIALRESEDRQRAIFEGSSDAIMLLDRQGFFDCNQATLNMFGYATREAFTQLHPADISPDLQSDGAASLLAASRRIEDAFEKGANRFDWIHQRSNGEVFPAEVWLTAFYLEGRRVLQATVRDVSDRKHAEEEIQRLNHMLEERVSRQTARLRQTNDALIKDIVEREEAEAELARQRAFFKQLFDNSPLGIVILDVNDCVIDANSAFEMLFQYSREEILGRSINELIIPEEKGDEARELSRRVISHERLEAQTVRRRKDGTLVNVSVLGSPILFGEDRIGVYGIYRDITERKRAESALAHERDLAEVTLHAIGDAVIRTDQSGRIQYMNPVAQELTGWSDEQARGVDLVTVFRIINEETGEVMASPVEECLRTQRVVGVANHAVLLARHGKQYAIEDNAAPIRDRDGRLIGVVLVFRDVSERRRTADKIAWQASHDALTGLVNRFEFERRLEHVLRSPIPGERRHAMLYMDLDQFKVVNDTCGHPAGDEMLRQLTGVLTCEVRDQDTLARLGGDEFGLLLTNCSLDDALAVAEKLIDIIQSFRFVWEEKTFTIGVSIGVVEIDEASTSLSALLGAADSACYSAKERGRNRIRVYRDQDADIAQRHDEMSWVSRITEAFEADRFLLFHQRIVPLHDAEKGHQHSELLLRMRDPDGKMIAPNNFIPSAERYSLMPRLDRWVIEHAFQSIKRRLEAEPGAPEETYSINISGTTLNDEHFVAFVRDMFAVYKIPARMICFEITETAAIANLHEAATFVHRIRSLGSRISLDDFGSGLSSFAYLKALDVDFLKIDGAFVKDMADDPVDCAMVETIHRVGRIMGIRTVAEYVESAAVLAKLGEIGVDYAQGTAVHEPEPWLWGAR